MGYVLRSVIGLSFCVGACDITPAPLPSVHPTILHYTSPEDSGLRAVRPYPNPDDVCQVIGESDAVRNLLDHESTLIACPKHEKGAIEDRKRDGAKIVGIAQHWLLLSISTPKTMTPLNQWLVINKNL